MNSTVNSLESALLQDRGQVSRTGPGLASALESFGNELSSAFRSDLRKLGVDLRTVSASASTSRPISADPHVHANISTANHSIEATPGEKLLTLPPNAADDAYWSRQPSQVQQLRYIANESQREVLARDLAAQGYSIDVPIMVWGWDAGQTMALRQSYGYTWVPSATSQGIQEAPGFHLPGLVAYDPHNPPPGSILVPSGAIAT